MREKQPSRALINRPLNLWTRLVRALRNSVYRRARLRGIELLTLRRWFRLRLAEVPVPWFPFRGLRHHQSQDTVYAYSRRASYDFRGFARLVCQYLLQHQDLGTRNVLPPLTFGIAGGGTGLERGGEGLFAGPVNRTSFLLY